jgi:hypothetical protein
MIHSTALAHTQAAEDGTSCRNRSSIHQNKQQELTEKHHNILFSINLFSSTLLILY